MADLASKTRGCPVCGKLSDEKFQPFCCKRCADVDLNRWLSGVYSIPLAEDNDEDGERDKPQAPDDNP